MLYDYIISQTHTGFAYRKCICILYYKIIMATNIIKSTRNHTLKKKNLFALIENLVDSINISV